MVQAAKRLRFQLEAPRHLLVGVSRLDDLERDDAVRFFLLGFVDRTHAALRDESQDPVMANGFRNTRSHRARRGRCVRRRARLARSILRKRSRGGT
jgi:hypothetical protein